VCVPLDVLYAGCYCNIYEIAFLNYISGIPWKFSTETLPLSLPLHFIAHKLKTSVLKIVSLLVRSFGFFPIVSIGAFLKGEYSSAI